MQQEWNVWASNLNANGFSSRLIGDETKAPLFAVDKFVPRHSSLPRCRWSLLVEKNVIDPAEVTDGSGGFYLWMRTKSEQQSMSLISIIGYRRAHFRGTICLGWRASSAPADCRGGSPSRAVNEKTWRHSIWTTREPLEWLYKYQMRCRWLR